MKNFTWRIFFATSILSVVSVYAVAYATYASTTIDSNINTGGTLDVTGAVTLGSATSTASNGWNISAGCFAINGICEGTGTVTSVSGSGGTTGLTLTGGAITTSGTLTLGGTLAQANGGTGASSFGIPFYTFFNATTTDALTQGSSNKYYSTLLFATDLAGTTTDALAGGSTNKYFSNSLVGAYISGSTTVPHIGGDAYGGNDMLVWNGSAWTVVATSTLGISGSSQWITSGSDIYYITGKVGIGNTGPTEALDVAGNANITGVYKINNATILQADGNIGTNGANIALGYLSGSAGTWDAGITSLGSEAGNHTYDGYQWQDTYVGAFAGQNNSGHYRTGNTFIGHSAGKDSTGGQNNSFLGLSAGQSITGSNNTFLGTNAGYTDGSVVSDITVTNATAVGYNAEVTRSNSLILGGTGAYAVNVGIGTTSPSAELAVTGGLFTTASSTMMNGIDLTGGCFSVNGTCITAGTGPQGPAGSSQWADGVGGVISYIAGDVGIGTTNPTALLDVNGLASTTNLTISALGTPAGTFLAVDPMGNVIATTTPSGGGVTGSGNSGQVTYWNGTGSVASSAGFLFSAPAAGAILTLGDNSSTGGNMSITPGTGSGNTFSGHSNLLIGTNNTADNTSLAVGSGNNAGNNYDVLFGENNSTPGCNDCFAFGNSNAASGQYSLLAGQSNTTASIDNMAFGNTNLVAGAGAIGIGSFTNTNATQAITIGSGVNNGNKLSNIIANSLAIGFNSTVPTLTVTASPGPGTDTVGNVGIGTTSPSAELAVTGGLFTTASSTMMNGINLTDGCFSINGMCISGGGGGSTAASSITSGTFGAGDYVFPSILTVNDNISTSFISATSTTATSTFSGSIQVGGSASTTQLVVGGVGGTTGTINKMLFGTCTFTDGVVMAGATQRIETCKNADASDLVGVIHGDIIIVTPTSFVNHVVMGSASSTVDGSISIALDAGGAPVTPGTAVFSWIDLK
ncbi:MAG: hypothetical protein HY225_02345 [Candidatus Vogelbacteria bacterium]|nr:hypothetical protein [Candidatus Vogelbacteria bacterium]